MLQAERDGENNPKTTTWANIHRLLHALYFAVWTSKK